MVFDFIDFTMQSPHDLGTALEKVFPTDFSCLSPWPQRNQSVTQSQERRDNQKEHSAVSPCNRCCGSSSQAASNSNCFTVLHMASHILQWVPTFLQVFRIPPYSRHLITCFTLHPDIVQVCSNTFLGTNSIDQALKNRLVFRSEMSSFRFARRMPNSCTGLACGVSREAGKASNQTSGCAV